MFMLKGEGNKDGMYSVLCPWRHEHTPDENVDTGTALFPRTDGSAGIECHHSHDIDWPMLKAWFESNGIDIDPLMAAYQLNNVVGVAGELVPRMDERVAAKIEPLVSIRWMMSQSLMKLPIS